MTACTDDERREVARMLRERAGKRVLNLGELLWCIGCDDGDDAAAWNRLADLIEPSYKPDAKYEAWYNGLSHFGDGRGGPSTIRELLEEVVWTALTVDLGPNGNTDSTGVDEGGVYTNELFAEWEREALRLSGGCDRDALLALADEMQGRADAEDYDGDGRINAGCLWSYADRIREALGVVA